MFVILIGSKWSEASEFAPLKLNGDLLLTIELISSFEYIVITVEPLLYEQ